MCHYIYPLLKFGWQKSQYTNIGTTFLITLANMTNPSSGCLISFVAHWRFFPMDLKFGISSTKLNLNYPPNSALLKKTHAFISVKQTMKYEAKRKTTNKKE